MIDEEVVIFTVIQPVIVTPAQTVGINLETIGIVIDPETEIDQMFVIVMGIVEISIPTLVIRIHPVVVVVAGEAGVYHPRMDLDENPQTGGTIPAVLLLPEVHPEEEAVPPFLLHDSQRPR